MLLPLPRRMRRCLCHSPWCFALLAIASSICLFLVGKHLSEDGSHEIVIPGSLNQYCQPLTVPIRGEEGTLPFRHTYVVILGRLHSDDYRIDAIFILTRHGDRSALIRPPVSTHPNRRSACALKNSADRELFERFRQCVNSNGRINSALFRTAKVFSRYPPCPSEECSEAQLTPVGALQHIRLGEYVRRVYAPLFDRRAYRDKLHRILESVSTPYPRTFQSALAFLYGLVGLAENSCEEHTSRRTSNRFSIGASATTAFCSPQSNFSCGCPRAEMFRRRYHHDLAQYFGVWENEKERIYVDLLENTKDLFELDARPEDPVGVFDSWMASFVCRGERLPEQVTMRDLEILYAHVRRRNLHAFKLEAFQQLAVLDSYLLLASIARAARSLSSSETRKSPPRVYHFSGHDVSVSALIGTLGLHDEGRIPAYASRVIFELYRQVGTEERFFKVLFEGRDVSAGLKFCKRMHTEETLCGLKEFENFLNAILGGGGTWWERFEKGCREDGV